MDRYGELTPAGKQAIDERAAERERLFAEMRADRKAQYADQYSHIGVIIGSDLLTPVQFQSVYAGLATLSNFAMLEGRETAAGTLASLANGVARAGHQRFDLDLKGELLPPTDEGMTALVNQPAAGDISQPAAEPLAEDRIPEQLALAGDDVPITGMVADETGPDYISQPAAELDDDDYAGPLDLFEANEAVASPEVEDTPHARAAAKRRAAKRVTQGSA